jgi:hypothetical protein
MRLLIIFFLILCGCHIQTRQIAGSAKSDGRLGQALNGSEVILTGASLSAAKQICQSLSAKDVFFRQNYLNKKFRLRVNETNCSGVSKSTDFDAFLESNTVAHPLYYRPLLAISFYQYEETISDGVLSNICPKILNADTVTDTINSGNTRAVYTFTSNKVKIEFATKNPSTQSFIKDRTIEMQINPAGVIGPRTETTHCNNGASLIINQSILSLPI